MTTTLNKVPLSNSTHGRGIKVTQTAIATGDTIHTASAVTAAGLGDDITLFCRNSDTVSRTLTLGWGGTTAPDDILPFPIGAGQILEIVPGMFLRNGLIVKAAADAANVLVIWGHAVQSS